jgi:hypothetical protein
MKVLWFTQIAAVIRLEIRKTFFSRRGLWVYLLALMPLLIFGGHSWERLYHHADCDFGRDTNVFAGIYQLLNLRLVLFFGCLGIFMNLFRGEMLDRSLHFYFLSPMRREVLLLGKYCAGLLAAITIFTTGTVLQWAVTYAHFPWTAMEAYLRDGSGWHHVLSYAGVTTLGCVGYGSVFLLAGSMFKNPIPPAAAVLIWEGVNSFVPAVLQKFSVIYYLKSLCPVEAPPDVGPVFALMVVNADPISSTIAVPGILLFSVFVLVIAASRVRRMEIYYGVD